MNDTEDIILRPHFLSYLNSYLILLYFTAVNWFLLEKLFNVSNTIVVNINSFVLYLSIVLIPLIIISYIKSNIVFFLFGLLYSISFIYVTGFQSFDYIQFYNNLLILIVFIFFEIHRYSIKYIISKDTIIIEYNGIKSYSRIINLTRISDLFFTQGLVGKLFNFGNILPITESGYGIGNSSVGVGLAAKSNKFPLGFLLGSIKQKNIPNLSDIECLHGIKNPKMILHFLKMKV